MYKALFVPFVRPPPSCLSFHLTTYFSALTFCDKLKKIF